MIQMSKVRFQLAEGLFHLLSFPFLYRQGVLNQVHHEGASLLVVAQKLASELA